MRVARTGTSSRPRRAGRSRACVSRATSALLLVVTLAACTGDVEVAGPTTTTTVPLAAWVAARCEHGVRADVDGDGRPDRVTQEWHEPEGGVLGVCLADGQVLSMHPAGLEVLQLI